MALIEKTALRNFIDKDPIEVKGEKYYILSL
ncbi:MAG: hypothetical protein A370_05468 [Clostridium sp. Maddingley MBC34-26]|nr:MAG: hypothetical protein A370_05468 [Clostridium sp. Maddingley MBC34-26]